jgi:two-component system sensor histidine kinase UhpB
MQAGAPRRGGSRYLPLFWRLFIPNATLLAVACVVLLVEPANGHVAVLAGGLLLMLVMNVGLMRYAFAPLARLATLMERIDPLRPGERLPLPASQSEVTLLTESFNAMLDRLEGERRDSARRALSEREAERRRLARALRPEALDALGLVPALTNLTERLAERTGLEIVRDLQRDLPPMGDAEELVLFRIAQESLTNAIRHASASRVDVSLRRADGWVELRVRDDGTGLRSDNIGEGGIRTMRERAVSIGGRLEIRSGNGTPGTEVRLELPVGER